MEHKQVNSGKQKNPAEQITYSGSKWSTVSIARWLFQSTIGDSDSNHFL